MLSTLLLQVADPTVLLQPSAALSASARHSAQVSGLAWMGMPHGRSGAWHERHGVCAHDGASLGGGVRKLQCSPALFDC